LPPLSRTPVCIRGPTQKLAYQKKCQPENTVTYDLLYFFVNASRKELGVFVHMCAHYNVVELTACRAPQHTNSQTRMVKHHMSSQWQRQSRE